MFVLVTLSSDMSLHKHFFKHSYWTWMVLVPNIIRFSVYDAQWSTGHCFFVDVEGLIFYCSQPKIQAPQQPSHGNDVQPESWHGLNKCLYMQCTSWVPGACFQVCVSSERLWVHLFQIHSPSQNEAHKVGRTGRLALEVGSWSKLRH